MDSFTIFNISKLSSLIIQWFYYQDNNLEGFGVEPNGDWFKKLYADKIPFINFRDLDETEQIELLILDSEEHEYLISRELPPHLVLKPSHRRDIDT